MRTVKLNFTDGETGHKRLLECVIFSNKYVLVNWMTKDKYDRINKARLLRRAVINNQTR